MYLHTRDTGESSPAGSHERFYDGNFYLRQRRRQEFAGEQVHAVERRSRGFVNGSSLQTAFPIDYSAAVGRQSQERLVRLGLESPAADFTPSLPVQRLSVGQVNHSM